MLQPIPNPEKVDSALDTILAQGVLGAIALLLAAAVVVAIRGWLKEKDGRLDDQKEMSKALSGINGSLRDIVVEGNKQSSNLVLEASRSQDSVKSALHDQERSLEDMKESVDDMKASVDRLLLQEQVRQGMAQAQGKR